MFLFPFFVDQVMQSIEFLRRAERRVYYHHRDKAKCFPEKYISLILDGMDQSKTNIPHYITDSKVSSLRLTRFS